MNKDTVKQNNKNNTYNLRSDIQDKIKNGFISFLDDLLEVFPKNKNLFMCRVITHQIDKEDVCEMLYNELYDYNKIKETEYKHDFINSIYNIIFNINFLNYKNKDITNNIQFKLNDLYNSNNTNNQEYHEEYECIIKWIDMIHYLLKQLKNTQ